MGNLSKIKILGRNIYLFLSVLLAVIPLYYILYWTLINHLPQTLIAVNVPSTSFSPFPLSMKMQLIGFLTSLLPASALVYGLLQLRKLFSFYQEGIIFSLENVEIFKSTSKALFVWALLSILYESVKSIVFSVSAPPGSRVVSVTFTSAELTTLLAAGMLLIMARVMEEGRILAKEKELVRT